MNSIEKLQPTYKQVISSRKKKRVKKKSPSAIAIGLKDQMEKQTRFLKAVGVFRDSLEVTTHPVVDFLCALGLSFRRAPCVALLNTI